MYNAHLALCAVNLRSAEVLKHDAQLRESPSDTGWLGVN